MLLNWKIVKIFEYALFEKQYLKLAYQIWRYVPGSTLTEAALQFRQKGHPQ